jgi:hypothetical protein
VDGFVDNFREMKFLIEWFMESWSDTIHDDYGIIDRVSEYREHCREEKSIDLKLRKKVRCDDIESKCNYDIMSEWYSCDKRKWPACHSLDGSSKCILYIERYSDNRKSKGDVCRFFDICTEWFTDINISWLFDFFIRFPCEICRELCDECCF